MRIRENLLKTEKQSSISARWDKHGIRDDITFAWKYRKYLKCHWENVLEAPCMLLFFTFMYFALGFKYYIMTPVTFSVFPRMDQFCVLTFLLLTYVCTVSPLWYELFWECGIQSYTFNQWHPCVNKPGSKEAGFKQGSADGISWTGPLKNQ